MLARIYSFKLIVCLILLWLTLLAYGLAIYSSRVYRNLALENQVESLLSVIKLETQEAIDFLFDKQNRFVFNLQKGSDFLEALNDTDRNHLKSWLDQNFYRYIDNTENLRLKALIVRDLKGEIIAGVGDRREEDTNEIGRIAADMFDEMPVFPQPRGYGIEFV